jgi:hypothetical protein
VRERGPDESQDGVGYPTRYLKLPEFDVVGFTKIVQSGGEQLEAVRGDGRWKTLRDMAGSAGMIYGIASLDRQCPKGYYRYTVGTLAQREHSSSTDNGDELFTIHVAESGWVVFELADFDAQYGALWSDDPYRLVKRLGFSFNRAVGLHIDAFGPSFASGSNSMEFLMPVMRRT